RDALFLHSMGADCRAEAALLALRARDDQCKPITGQAALSRTGDRRGERAAIAAITDRPADAEQHRELLRRKNDLVVPPGGRVRRRSCALRGRHRLHSTTQSDRVQLDKHETTIARTRASATSAPTVSSVSSG